MGRRLERFGLSLVLALVLGPGSVGAQPASPELDRMREERRIALVIGNGAYGPSIGRLANPANDARDIAESLQSVGFQVTLKMDVDRDQMRLAVIEFGRALRDGGVGLFYYSGHAIQLDGVNYMIPLGAEVESEDYVPVETVDVNDVLARMGGADNRLNIVILDACRNNPFKGVFRSVTRGLALTLAPTGTFIAYAAAPGQPALDGAGTRNSPYTAALLEAIRQPGLRVEDVFKQVAREVLAGAGSFRQTPWTSSSITGDFFFHLPQPTLAHPTEPQLSAPAPKSPARAGMIDMAVWDAIKESRDAADFETFLEVYPDSPFAPFARNRAKALQAARTANLPPQELAREPGTTAPEPSAAAAQPEPAAGPAPATSTVVALPPAPEPAAPAPDPASVEAGLDLSREQRQGIQVALTALGHDTRGADGILGRNSRTALSSWQQAAGEPATGYLTAAQRVALLDAAKGALAESRQSPGPGTEFRDCRDCPLMVALAAGSFMMGSTEAERQWALEQGAKPQRVEPENPQHLVRIAESFAVSKYEVTF